MTNRGSVTKDSPISSKTQDIIEDTLPYAPVPQVERRNIFKRIGIVIGGTLVLMVGIAMIFLPGPAFVVIPAALAILGTELVWARRLLKRLKKTVGLKDAQDQTEKLQRAKHSDESKTDAGQGDLSNQNCDRRHA